jgi:hypothetical protein
VRLHHHLTWPRLGHQKAVAGGAGGDHPPNPGR